MKSNQQGFTLIELVMVIVILGILAAVAIPKFVNLSAQAEAAQEDGIIGGLRSGLYVHSSEQIALTGERSFPSNVFDALDTKPEAYDSTFATAAVVTNGAWGSDTAGARKEIWHRRKNGELYQWEYVDSSGQIISEGLQP